MSAKATSRRASGLAPAARGAGSARDRAKAPVPAGDLAPRSALPAMRATERRHKAAHPSEPAPALRRSKRAAHGPSLGGRLAAAIRIARLRASRAAEDYAARR
jgi:hypothetical protein